VLARAPLRFARARTRARCFRARIELIVLIGPHAPDPHATC
jgi:hypothetical protein